jgi:transposase
MKQEKLTLTHERVDDIPLLIGFLQGLNLPKILDHHLGSHHLHQGLSNGWLMTVWIAFLISQSNHRKVSVQDWACNHEYILNKILGQSLRPIEFSDDRLSILLRRLKEADWKSLESDLWKIAFEVYELPCTKVKLDSTSSFGYHEIHPDGLLQRGHSKDHRSDLPQLKIMAAVAQPTSCVIASDIHPENAADDRLYLPLIQRVRKQLNHKGLLYCGDCKMASLKIRSEIVFEQDYYLMPLPKTSNISKQMDTWIEMALAGKIQLKKITRINVKNEIEIVAMAYEKSRTLQSTVSGKIVKWKERVQMLRSSQMMKSQNKHLEERLRIAEVELKRLTPIRGRGHKQILEEKTLLKAIEEILTKRRVGGLLEVQWEREEQKQERYEGRGRGGPERKKIVEVKVRYVVREIKRNEKEIQRFKDHQGWRIQVTNLPKEKYSLRETVLLYNDGWSIERSFHLLKDSPLGIQPLYVRKETQIVGLTRLLLIALRVITLSEVLVRDGLKKEEEHLLGLYEGHPNRTTNQPTANRLLKAVSRMEITATKVGTSESSPWYLTPLPPLLEKILKLLNLSPALYTGIVEEGVR